MRLFEQRDPHVDDSGMCRPLIHKWAAGWGAWCFGCNTAVIEGAKTSDEAETAYNHHKEQRHDA